MLDRMEGRAQPLDGPFPEDWIGSTTRAVNPEQPRNDEGLARVRFGEQDALLADLIEADASYFLGASHLASFGTSLMVLVKFLDAAVRLPLQVHPTAEFARQFLGSSSGKTEAYVILSTRPEVADPFIYLGFQRPIMREQLRRMIVEQDIAAMEACFDRIPVQPGEVYLVPGGLPHAIGGGVLMVEVMEPTDLVARIEFNVAGRIIPEAARFMERDIEFALDMTSLAAWPVELIRAQWCCTPKLLEQHGQLRRESLIDERVTDRFRVQRLTFSGRTHWQPTGLTIFILTEGTCLATTEREQVLLRRYDRIIVPHGLKTLALHAEDRAVLLACCPPSAPFPVKRDRPGTVVP